MILVLNEFQKNSSLPSTSKGSWDALFNATGVSGSFPAGKEKPFCNLWDTDEFIKVLMAFFCCFRPDWCLK